MDRKSLRRVSTVSGFLWRLVRMSDDVRTQVRQPQSKSMRNPLVALRVKLRILRQLFVDPRSQWTDTLDALQPPFGQVNSIRSRRIKYGYFGFETVENRTEGEDFGSLTAHSFRPAAIANLE